MPLKRRVVRKRKPVMGGRRRVMRGRGLMDWFNKAKDFVKSNNLISRAADGLGYSDVGRTIRSFGYGRARPKRRVVRRRVMGRGIFDSIKSGFNTVKDYVKSNNLISKAASGLGYDDVARTIRSFGYGRRRRVGGMMLSPPFMGGRKRRVGGRVVFPAVYTTGLGGLSATTG